MSDHGNHLGNLFIILRKFTHLLESLGKGRSVSLLILYAISITLILGGAYLVYRVFRRKGQVLAIGLSISAAAVLALLWPIPIHGGFMILGESIYSELSRDWARRTDARSDQEKEAYLASLAERFAGELPLLRRSEPADGWEEVAYAPEQTAWLDMLNRQIWSEWLILPATPAWPPLNVAKQRCQQLAPVGYWSLPTEAEHVLMWKAGGVRVLPRTRAGTVSYSIDADHQMEIATYGLTASSDNAPGRSAQFAVRCVARGPNGPARGYIRRDVALEDWNRYQLSKSM